MDHIVQSLNDAYNKLLVAAAACLEAKQAANGERTERTDSALNSFHESYHRFQYSCDRAQEFVESVHRRIGSECLVDEATGPVSGKLLTENGKTAAVSPLSAVRLEQLSKAVRWMVIDLQHGGAPATSATGSNAGAGSVLASEDS